MTKTINDYIEGYKNDGKPKPIKAVNLPAMMTTVKINKDGYKSGSLSMTMAGVTGTYGDRKFQIDAGVGGTTIHLKYRGAEIVIHMSDDKVTEILRIVDEMLDNDEIKEKIVF